MTQDKGERVFADIERDVADLIAAVASRRPDGKHWVNEKIKAAMLAAETEPPVPAGEVTQAARKHVATLEWLASQYLPGGPRDVKGACQAAIAALRTTSASEGEAVAVIGKDWSLLWASQEPLSTIVERTGIKIGSPLYTKPAPDSVTALRTALHEIDVEVFNTIPPDGNEAAWGALGRIRDIIAPFRTVRPGTALNAEKPAISSDRSP